ncbi:MAG: S8 family serine peptidase [Acidobacteriia bacterium]|nr:S8 family serine peptidase [Terriglobia bacterium]
MTGSSAATGRGVRIAVVDSGVHAAHPHVGSVAGGVAIDEDGREHDDYVDRLGHGTAVAAAIKDKAPDAEIYAVKVFDRSLSTRLTTLVAAIEWAARHGMHLVNLSLGTARAEHERALDEAVRRAASQGLVIVAAAEDEGVRWLPGSLPGVIGVQLDVTCPRDEYRAVGVNGSTVFRASGFPREIPGVPPERNLNGISFAVANMTGFVARARETARNGSIDEIVRALAS